jgi:hypothetical protein
MTVTLEGTQQLTIRVPYALYMTLRRVAYERRTTQTEIYIDALTDYLAGEIAADAKRRGLTPRMPPASAKAGRGTAAVTSGRKGEQPSW